MMMNKLSLILMLVALSIPANAQQTYHLDVKKSKILWNARKTMGGHFGYLLLNSGTLNFSTAGQPESGTFSLNMNSMHATDDTNASGNKRVDQELRTEGYFSMDKYPEATVTIKQITPVPHSVNFKVSGELTIKGITNPIEFTAAIQKKGTTILATAQTTIDRLKWNIDMQKPHSWNLFAAVKDKVITTEIAITLNLVFML